MCWKRRGTFLLSGTTHAFDLNDFIEGVMPPKERVAVAQTLVNPSA